jgi:hypothetical protein
MQCLLNRSINQSFLGGTWFHYTSNISGPQWLRNRKHLMQPLDIGHASPAT